MSVSTPPRIADPGRAPARPGKTVTPPVPGSLAWGLFLALALALAAGLWTAPALADTRPAPALDEATLVGMLDDLVKYYDEARPGESRIVALIQGYDKDKDSLEFKKLRILFDTYQKATTSLNNLVDVLYLSIKLGHARENDTNEYIVNRIRNIVTFLNNMVYLLTARNQEMELGASSDVQKLYEAYLVRLTTLLYELNKSVSSFHD
ncbi:hypothetical protein [Solidesulfovibrio sp.]